MGNRVPYRMDDLAFDLYDRGALAMLTRLEELRREHPIRWWLGGGRKYMKLMREVVETKPSDQQK